MWKNWKKEEIHKCVCERSVQNRTVSERKRAHKMRQRYEWKCHCLAFFKNSNTRLFFRYAKQSIFLLFCHRNHTVKFRLNSDKQFRLLPFAKWNRTGVLCFHSFSCNIFKKWNFNFALLNCVQPMFAIKYGFGGKAMWCYVKFKGLPNPFCLPWCVHTLDSQNGCEKRNVSDWSGVKTKINNLFCADFRGQPGKKLNSFVFICS